MIRGLHSNHDGQFLRTESNHLRQHKPSAASSSIRTLLFVCVVSSLMGSSIAIAKPGSKPPAKPAPAPIELGDADAPGFLGGADAPKQETPPPANNALANIRKDLEERQAKAAADAKPPAQEAAPTSPRRYSFQECIDFCKSKSQFEDADHRGIFEQCNNCQDIDKAIANSAEGEDTLIKTGTTYDPNAPKNQTHGAAGAHTAPTVASNDSCATAALAQYYALKENERNGSTPDEFISAHGCNRDKSTLSALQTTGQFTAMGVQAMAGAAGGVAQATVQAKAADAQTEGDIHKEALHSMATATYVSGTGNLIGGAALAVFASKAARISTNQDNDADAAAGATKGGPVNGSKLTRAGHAFRDLNGGDANDEKDAVRLNSEGLRDVRAGAAAKKDLSEKASNQALAQFVQGSVMLASGVASMVQAATLNKLADSMNTDVATTPTAAYNTVAAATPSGTVQDNVAPPNNTTGVLGDGVSSVTAADTEKEQNAPAGAIPPPLFGGGGNPGGLKDAPLGGGGGGMNGVGSSSGGGGGVSGGGGGGGAAGDGGDRPGGDQAVGDRTKFDSAGAGGAGFAAAGAGGNKRANDTGMDFGGLLSQFMPKQGAEDRKPASDIVNFGSAGTKSGGQSDTEQGILGPNSNLFARVTRTTVVEYTKGSIR